MGLNPPYCSKEYRTQRVKENFGPFKKESCWCDSDLVGHDEEKSHWLCGSGKRTGARRGGKQHGGGVGQLLGSFLSAPRRSQMAAEEKEGVATEDSERESIYGFEK